MKRSIRPYLLLALLNTGILFVLTSWLWGLPWLAGDEKAMIWATSTIKLINREIPNSEEFAFINVSYDKMLIDKYDDFGFPVGNQAITDRQKLTSLIQAVNQSEKKPIFMFFDIYFEEQTAYDSLLNSAFNNLDNHIVSAHLDDENNLMQPSLENINIGLSDYVVGSVFEGVYKFQLFFKDSLKLTPLLIHEALSDDESSVLGPFTKVGNTYSLNHFILNYRLLQQDIENLETGFNPINLGELLILPAADIADFLHNKIVVIGDFYENDMHETIFEVAAGPIILVNAYLAISNQDTVVNVLFLLIVVMIYFGLSFIAIYPEDMIERYIKNRYGNIKWVGNLTSFMSYFILLIITSSITFFLFNIHLNVFMLSVYIFIIEKISMFFHKKLSLLKGN